MAAEEAPIQVQILSFQAGWRANYPHTQSTDRKNVNLRCPKYKGGRNTESTEGPRIDDGSGDQERPILRDMCFG